MKKMNDKVFCRNCKYYFWDSYSPVEIWRGTCKCKAVYDLEQTPVCCYKVYGLCDTMNKNNDCYNYKPTLKTRIKTLFGNDTTCG